MRELFLGEYIRQERLKQGITQEQLCEGICEPITVSRMENGKQFPSYSRIRAFLQRLGLPDERYFALLSKNELEVKALQDEIRADSIRFERAALEERPRIRAAGLQKLEELEKIAEQDDRVVRQYIMSERAVFGRPEGSYTTEERLNILLDALRITVPNLDLEEINLGLYSMDETTLLNKIANAYAELGSLKKAIDIYRQLLKYVQKHYCEGISRYAGKLTLISHNYANLLLRAGYYDDAIEIARSGWKACVEYAHYQFLPGFQHLLGVCYFHKEDLEKCKEYYKCAYYLYKSVGDDCNRLRLEKDAKKHLGENFSF